MFPIAFNIKIYWCSLLMQRNARISLLNFQFCPHEHISYCVFGQVAHIDCSAPGGERCGSITGVFPIGYSAADGFEWFVSQGLWFKFASHYKTKMSTWLHVLGKLPQHFFYFCLCNIFLQFSLQLHPSKAPCLVLLVCPVNALITDQKAHLTSRGLSVLQMESSPNEHFEGQFHL